MPPIQDEADTVKSPSFPPSESDVANLEQYPARSDFIIDSDSTSLTPVATRAEYRTWNPSKAPNARFQFHPTINGE
jgi:hypothetical protein